MDKSGLNYVGNSKKVDKTNYLEQGFKQWLIDNKCPFIVEQPFSLDLGYMNYTPDFLFVGWLSMNSDNTMSYNYDANVYSIAETKGTNPFRNSAMKDAIQHKTLKNLAEKQSFSFSSTLSSELETIFNNLRENRVVYYKIKHKTPYGYVNWEHKFPTVSEARRQKIVLLEAEIKELKESHKAETKSNKAKVENMTKAIKYLTSSKKLNVNQQAWLDTFMSVFREETK